MKSSRCTEAFVKHTREREEASARLKLLSEIYCTYSADTSEVIKAMYAIYHRHTST